MSDHVKALEKAREMMVKSRREMAEALSELYDAKTTPRNRPLFNEIQHTIEQIDKAIEDERKSAPQKPVSGFGAKDDRYSKEPPDDNQGYR
jgi:hypothetical protein